MKRVHKIVGIVLSFAIITLIAGCGGGSSTPTGVMSVSITDKAIDGNVTAVNIKVIGIEYHLKNSEWADVNDFKDNNFTSQTFNLLDLQDGKSLHLGDFEVPAGDYTQIRFMLAIPENEGEVKSNPDCNITIEKGGEFETHPLFVPSGGQSGYKAIGGFVIEADAKLEVTADWDASRSVEFAGDKYILKPVIRLVVNELSGWINGTVVDFAVFGESDSLWVYAYINDEDNLSIYNTHPVQEEGNDFLNAVTGGKVDMTDGNFTLAFLGAGVYDLVIVHYNDGNFINADVVEDVPVDIATGTPVDVNTSDIP